MTTTDRPDEPAPIAIAITVSQEEQVHFAALRERSYELAVERGHMRRDRL